MICVLKHIIVWNCQNGEALCYQVDSTGIERDIDHPIGTGKSNTTARFYRCNNCNRQWEGDQSFDVIRDHIGHSHDPLIPFTDVFESTLNEE